MEIREKAICLRCYWAYPEDYDHIAMKQLRRIDISWEGEEVAVYDKMKAEAAKQHKEIPKYVKDIIERELKKRG